MLVPIDLHGEPSTAAAHEALDSHEWRLSTSAELPLRRADWRFLLPAPAGDRFRHLVVLGGSPGLEQQLSTLSLATRVSTQVPGPDGADALVLLADAQVPLADAVRCLAEDGVLYWEVERRPWRGLTRGRRWITRQLQAARLHEQCSFWVIPDFANPRRYLPLDRGSALAWFFDTRFVANTPARVALQRLVLSGPQGTALVGALVPCRAVIATVKPRPTAPAAVLARAALPPALLGPEVRTAMFTSGQDDGSRLVALPFRPGTRAPELVLKLARLPAFTGHSEREQATLRQLRSALPEDLRQTLPEPRGSRGIPPIFLEGAIPGRMIATSTGRWQASFAHQVDDLRLAAEWLARFHEATSVRRLIWSPAEQRRWIEPALARYEAIFELRPAEQVLRAQVERRSAELAGQSLPIVWCHNDFNPWHVYRSGASVSVIDWEFGQDDLSAREGLPACDLVYFALHWLHLARAARDEPRQVRACAELFLGSQASDRRVGAARAALDQYLMRVGIPPAFLPLLIAHTWVERAVDWHERQVAAGSSSSAVRLANAFARYVRVLTAGADLLFASDRALR